MRTLKVILHRAGQHMQAHRVPGTVRSLALLITVAFTLAACETTPPGDRNPDQRYIKTRAEQLVRAGRHEQAAELYEQIAATAETADRFWLAAARQRFAAGQWRAVLLDLENIRGPLQDKDALERSLLGASAALSQDDSEAAEYWLSTLPTVIPESALADLLWVRTRLALARGDFSAALELMNERELWLSSSEDVLAGRRALLETIQSQHRKKALPEESAIADPLLAGWLSLASLLADADRDPFVVRSALGTWQQAYPEHPAMALMPELLAAYRRMLDYPQQLAVLLPLSGRLQAAGDAVRDGLIAAYMRHAEERPAVRFYDTSEQDIQALYGQAVLNGADLVIGPLTRDNVLKLAERDMFSVPTLALNNLPAELPAAPGLYQFGLAPEDEARQAAHRLLEDGLVQGIALVPANEWGGRLLEAFSAELDASGGTLLDHQAYDPRNEDFSAAITTVLHLSESRARYRSLTGILGRRIEFEPRRRQDVQFIFLGGTPDVGRLMRPQLRFHYASSLPVYATSAIYEPAPDRNGDLNGVMFDDMPWVIDSNPDIVALREELAVLWPDGMRTWPRLYALGFDAYRLVPALFGGQLPQDETIQGLTGDLSLTIDGRIHRTLMWAKFERGVPVPMVAPEIESAALPDPQP